MEKENNVQNQNIFEILFTQYKEDLIKKLNIKENLTNNQIKEILISIIKEYEIEFYHDFNEIFIYNYYCNLLYNQNKPIEQILNFVKTKETLKESGKQEVLEAEKIARNDVLYLYQFKLHKNEENTYEFISQITGQKIPINYEIAEIINNKDIFHIPPKGKPNLRGPLATYTIEYSPNYWQDFKNYIQKYVTSFEINHSKDFIEDLKDYRYWLHKYYTFICFINHSQIKNNEKEEKHVKN